MTMFAVSDLPSVNAIADLRPGRYLADCSAFTLADSDRIVFLYGYTMAGEKECCCVDVVVRSEDGELTALDILKLSDGSWRDSNGTRAASLSVLLPAELRTAKLVDVFELNDKVVEG